jgi:hypothetical protein
MVATRNYFTFDVTEQNKMTEMIKQIATDKM